MQSGITWTLALGTFLLKTHAYAHTPNGLLGLQAPFYALHAALTALQKGLSQAAQGHWMLALCAKTKQILHIVPAGCLKGCKAPRA